MCDIINTYLIDRTVIWHLFLIAMLIQLRHTPFPLMPVID